MSTDTDKRTADQDGMLADTSAPTAAEITASQHPELGLKDLPRVPDYSGTRVAVTESLDPLTVIDAWDLNFDLGTTIQSIADGVTASPDDVSAFRNAVFHLEREITRRSGRR